jgi:hypothetical protein
LLQIFGNAKRIKDPNIYAEAIAGLTEIIDIFMHAESKAPYSQILEGNNILLLLFCIINLLLL